MRPVCPLVHDGAPTSDPLRVSGASRRTTCLLVVAKGAHMASNQGSRPKGYPCWLDLTAPDVKQAAEFYAHVFGWDYDVSGPEYGHYHMAMVDGHSVAGLGQPMAGDAPPAAWTLYFAADDAAAMAAHAADLGGTVLVPAMEVPRQGQMAIVADPTGAVFGLWQPIAHHGFGIDGVAGTLAWCELNTPDANAARAFYQALLVADAPAFDRPGTNAYFSLQKDGAWIAGIVEQPSGGTKVPPHWMPFFQVDDANAAIAAVQAGGGTVAFGPFDSAYGRVVVVADPFGAHFSVLQPPAG